MFSEDFLIFSAKNGAVVGLLLLYVIVYENESNNKQPLFNYSKIDLLFP